MLAKELIRFVLLLISTEFVVRLGYILRPYCTPQKQYNNYSIYRIIYRMRRETSIISIPVAIEYFRK